MCRCCPPACCSGPQVGRCQDPPCRLSDCDMRCWTAKMQKNGLGMRRWVRMLLLWLAAAAAPALTPPWTPFHAACQLAHDMLHPDADWHHFHCYMGELPPLDESFDEYTGGMGGAVGTSIRGAIWQRWSLLLAPAPARCCVLACMKPATLCRCVGDGQPLLRLRRPALDPWPQGLAGQRGGAPSAHSGHLLRGAGPGSRCERAGVL